MFSTLYNKFKEYFSIVYYGFNLLFRVGESSEVGACVYLLNVSPIAWTHEYSLLYASRVSFLDSSIIMKYENIQSNGKRSVALLLQSTPVQSTNEAYASVEHTRTCTFWIEPLQLALSPKTCKSKSSAMLNVFNHSKQLAKHTHTPSFCDSTLNIIFSFYKDKYLR